MTTSYDRTSQLTGISPAPIDPRVSSLSDTALDLLTPDDPSLSFSPIQRPYYDPYGNLLHINDAVYADMQPLWDRLDQLGNSRSTFHERLALQREQYRVRHLAQQLQQSRKPQTRHRTPPSSPLLTSLHYYDPHHLELLAANLTSIVNSHPACGSPLHLILVDFQSLTSSFSFSCLQYLIFYATIAFPNPRDRNHFIRQQSLEQYGKPLSPAAIASISRRFWRELADHYLGIHPALKRCPRCGRTLEAQWGFYARAHNPDPSVAADYEGVCIDCRNRRKTMRSDAELKPRDEFHYYYGAAVAAKDVD